jgi:hypothetical protein
MMRSFSVQLGIGAESDRAKTCLHNRLWVLKTAKPTLPELTPETKGIAEDDRPLSCA